MTKAEIADLRIRCVEVFISTCSKADIENDVIFAKGEKLWKTVLETLKKPPAELS